MRTTLVSAVTLVTLLASTGAFAQQPSSGHQHEPSQSQPAAPGAAAWTACIAVGCAGTAWAA